MKFHWRSKCAIFDYDWTLVKPKENSIFPKNVDDWEWFRPSVKQTIQDYYKRGYGIVIVTNQSKKWKTDQIHNVVQLLEVPVLICIANLKEHYKPNTFIFDQFRGTKQLNLPKSFMVGDALGRKNDHSDVDLQFAKRLGINQIYPPEDFFEKSKSKIAKTPCVKNATKVNLPNHDTTVDEQEIVIMMGYPGSGKSTFCARNFPSHIIIAGDEYKTTKKMINAAKEHIKLKKSIVFDATNPSKAKRAEYIEFAKLNNLPIRCVFINTSLSESLIQNNKRDKPVPKIVYNIYKSKFESPDISEGFKEVIVIDHSHQKMHSS